MSAGDSAVVSAGVKLRREMEAALRRGSPDQSLEWTEQESVALVAACSTADRAEVIQAAFDAERSGDARAALLVKLSAEKRALDRQVVDLLAKVNPGLGPGVSERHQKASRARWGAQR
jgi:hypothetical protein